MSLNPITEESVSLTTRLVDSLAIDVFLLPDNRKSGMRRAEGKRYIARRLVVAEIRNKICHKPATLQVRAVDIGRGALRYRLVPCFAPIVYTEYVPILENSCYFGGLVRLLGTLVSW